MDLYLEYFDYYFNMKTLSEYINENRLRVGTLPFTFEQFERFVKECILDNEFDDTLIWDEMKDLIIKKYNEKTWEMFKGWCESVYEFHNGRNSKISLKQFYDELSLIPLDRVMRGLGAGSNGVVWEVSKDKVIKLFYNDHIKQQDKIFLEYCLNHQTKVFPEIYKIGDNWVMMEKLKTFTPKLKKWFEYIDDKKFEGKTIYDWTIEKNVDESIFDDFGKDVYKWCKMCQEEFKHINSPYVTWPGDLFLKNCGERNNGDIVFFDI